MTFEPVLNGRHGLDLETIGAAGVIRRSVGKDKKHGVADASQMNVEMQAGIRSFRAL